MKGSEKKLKKHKLKTLSILMVPIILLLILIMSFNTYAATEKQTITFYLPEHYDESNGWGPFCGTFTQHINISSDMVFFEEFQSNGIRNVGYAWLRSNGSVGYEYLGLGTNTWAGAYDSDTINEEGNIYTLNRHIKKAMMYGSLVYASLPYISGLDNAKEYLSSGYTSPDNIVNYDDIYGLQSPDLVSIENDSVFPFKFYITLEQSNIYTDCKLKYFVDFLITTDEYEYSSTSDIYEYDIVPYHYLVYDWTDICTSGVLDDIDDFKNISIHFYNEHSDGRVSDVLKVNISASMGSMQFMVVDGDTVGNWHDIYTKDGTINDTFRPDNIGSLDIFSDTDSGSFNFVNGILTAFGLIGSSGLISAMAIIFSYVPVDFWMMYGSFMLLCIIIALFKLFIH